MKIEIRKVTVWKWTVKGSEEVTSRGFKNHQEAIDDAKENFAKGTKIEVID